MKASVLVFTYNHGKYIRQCLESILSQRTSFDFEIIIADDGSTDNTIEIIKEIYANHPHKIRLLLSQNNKGIFKNVMQLEHLVASEYIAVLDGDDYWCYGDKLATQVKFLDNNTAYNGCFHDCIIKHEDGAHHFLFNKKNKYSEVYSYNKDVYPTDILNRLIIPSSSLVIRRSSLTPVGLSLIKDAYSLDWKIICVAIRNSKFRYLNECWSTYRNHLKGFSKTNNIQSHLSNIEYLKSLQKDPFFKGFQKTLLSSIHNEYTIIYRSRHKIPANISFIRLLSGYLYIKFINYVYIITNMRLTQTLA
jgi:glycosyltransferase involved in cell wall biosynthesis